MVPSFSVWPVLVVVILTAIGGCSDANSMFTGRWSVEPVLDAPWPRTKPELIIGHFGSEVTGVLWFTDEFGVRPEVGDIPCPCTFIQHRALNLDRQELSISTSFCDAEVWLWDLVLEGDPVADATMTGTLTIADENGTTMDVTLKREDTFVRDDDKACP